LEGGGRRKIGGNDRMEKRWKKRNTAERRETIILHQI
jgi:hypothetical protein